ncbi:MAG: hypothetical protein ACRCX2_04445 [Paraclostridium sp.]
MRYDELITIKKQQTTEQGQVDILWKANVPCKILNGSTKIVYYGSVQSGLAPITIYINDRVPINADDMTVILPNGVSFYPKSAQVLGRKTVLGGFVNA